MVYVITESESRRCSSLIPYEEYTESGVSFASASSV